MWIATAERSREIDRAAREEFGIPTRVLMERAALAVLEALQGLAPAPAKITVFCGKGNNGGDGFALARLAKENGYTVDCLVAAKPEELNRDAADQLKAAAAQGIKAVFCDDERYERKCDALGSRDAVVDALLGTGATGDVKDSIRDAIQWINRSGVPVISIDVPSGIHCDTGEELGESVWACRTVTFGLPKPFLFQGLGLEHCGYWTVAEIGFPSALLNYPTEAKLLEGNWVGSLLPERLRASHKGENGSVLVVAGSSRMPGAASLAAKAALRAGAGMVTVAGCQSVCNAVACNVPEAIILPLPENNGVISGDAARLLLDKQTSYHSTLFGPGLTHEQPVLEFLQKVWKDWQSPCVIDADALNSVSKGVELPISECVLTPHPGEMSRLLQCSIAEVQADRFNTILNAVEKLNKTVLLKGPYSIVCEPFQPTLVNCTGNPGMASAGMGDVLSGVIAALLGQDLPAYYAASCGMYWHGMAGDICAEEIGPIGYTAMDVANALPKARPRLTQLCDGQAYS